MDSLLCELQGLSSDEQHSNTLEQILMSRLLAWRANDGAILSYLCQCHIRLARQSAKEEEGQNGNLRVRLQKECKYLIISYVGLVLTMPSMFEQPEQVITQGSKLLASYMLGMNENGTLNANNGECPAELIHDLVERYKGEEEREIFQMLFVPFFEFLSEQISQVGILGRLCVVVDCLEEVLHERLLQDLLVNHPKWRSDCTLPAQSINKACLLGNWLDVGVDPIHIQALLELLPSRDPLYKKDMDGAFYTLRTALHLLHVRMHRLLYKLIKTSPIHREALLEVLGWIARANGDRVKMHVDPTTISSDRLIWNIYAILLHFCEPFLSPTSPKIALIDIDYYIRSKRIGSREITRLNATQEDYSRYQSIKMQEYGGENAPYQPNFVTECFFLTVQYFRLGPIRMINEYLELLRMLREAQNALESFERQAAGAGPMAAMNALAIKNVKGKMREMLDAKLSLDLLLLDEQLMEQSFSLISLIIAWLFSILELDQSRTTTFIESVSVQSAQDINDTSNSVSSSGESFSIFSMLPEFLVESIGEYALFISRFRPEFWTGGRNIDLLMKFMVTFLDRSSSIKNPYLRAKFVDILFGFTDPTLEHLFDAYPLVVEQLVPKLMHFYVEVERTGASSQFYDKFNMRYNISKIFKCLWAHPLHKVQFKHASEDKEQFVRFANLLINDVTYLLDESIAKLIQIHEQQAEMDAPTWQQRPPTEQQEALRGLQMMERQCESYVLLANATLDMLEYLTSEIVEPFLRSEIVDRFAAMLDANLLQLTGRKCSSLKVRHPERYHFEPRQMLSMLVGTLLNMSQKEPFLKAVARDGRSFSRTAFEQASALLRRHAIRPETDITRFERIIVRIEALAMAEQQEEQDLGDIPSEFLDPLMCTLMEDPVILQTSRVTVDRSTISAHLLNDPHDPFNRMPLSPDQIIPNEELRAAIQKFKQSKSKQKP